MDDEQLMRLAQVNGDEAAFDDLVVRHHAKLTRFCRSKLYRWDLAEDAAQEAWLTAWHQRMDWESQGEGSFRAWLYALAQVACYGVRGRGPVLTSLESDPPARDENEEDFEARERHVEERLRVLRANAIEDAARALAVFHALAEHPQQNGADRQQAVRLRFWADYCPWLPADLRTKVKPLRSKKGMKEHGDVPTRVELDEREQAELNRLLDVPGGVPGFHVALYLRARIDEKLDPSLTWQDAARIMPVSYSTVRQYCLDFLHKL